MSFLTKKLHGCRFMPVFIVISAEKNRTEKAKRDLRPFCVESKVAVFFSVCKYEYYSGRQCQNFRDDYGKPYPVKLENKGKKQYAQHLVYKRS